MTDGRWKCRLVEGIEPKGDLDEVRETASPRLPLGMNFLHWGVASEECRAVFDDLAAALRLSGIVVRSTKLDDPEGLRFADVAEDSQLERVRSALDEAAPVPETVAAALLADNPRLIAAWVERGQVTKSHCLIKGLRLAALPDMCTVLLGPAITEALGRWLEDPRVLSRVLRGVGYYVRGDFAVALKALIHDQFRVEPRLETIPGLVWEEDERVRTNPARRPRQFDRRSHQAS